MYKEIKKAALAVAAFILAASLFGCSDTETSGSVDSTSGDNTSSVISDTEIPDSSVTEDNSGTDNSRTDNSDSNSSTEEVPGHSDNPIVNDTREGIVNTARALIGIDFATGMATPEEGFDNSGLIYYVLRENGFINCPRGTSSQMKMGTCVDLSDILPGDLLYFADAEEGSDSTLYFGGIYIGDNTMIYSPYPGEKVKTADISSGYWSKRFYCAVSVG